MSEGREKSRGKVRDAGSRLPNYSVQPWGSGVSQTTVSLFGAPAAAWLERGGEKHDGRG